MSDSAGRWERALRSRLWLPLSFVAPVVCGLIALHEAFSDAYVMPIDARVHVFWMQRFLDPSLFPHDLIADYAQSVSPPGTAAFYRVLAWLGLNPLVAVKLVPLPIMLLTTWFTWRALMAIRVVPAAACLSTLLFNEAIWAHQDVASGTARAFLYPPLSALLYFLIVRKVRGAAISAFLLALFYPPAGLIGVALLMTDLLVRRPPRAGRDYRFAAIGLAVALVVLVPIGLKRSPYGPVLTASVARTMPELGSRGDFEFFTADGGRDWLYGSRAGAFALFESPLATAGMTALTLLAILRRRLPLMREISPRWVVLLWLAIASVAVYSAAHLVLFRLYHPGRYTMHTFRLLFAIAGGVSTISVLDALHRRRSKLVIPACCLVVGLVAAYPMYLSGVFGYPNTGYIHGRKTGVYEFLRRQPRDITIATISAEAQNIPSFAARSVLTGRAFALPWHVGYRQQTKQRMIDLLRAQYSADPAEVLRVIQTYRIDFWLIDRDAFEPWYLPSQEWAQAGIDVQEETRRVEAGGVPVMRDLMTRCMAFEDVYEIVVRADCAASVARGGTMRAAPRHP